MSDLISRRQAIDALRKMQTYKLVAGDDMLLIDQEVAQTELMMLPPVQPEHCEDAVSREAVFSMIDTYMNKSVELHYLPTSDGIKKLISILPSAQPETNCSEIPNNWIPCSERLPDDLAEVNVTWINHEPEPYYDFVKDKPFTASAVYYKGDWYWYSSVCVDVLAEYGKNEIDEIDDAIEITAWMPLPEPYQEGGEQE